MKELKDKKSNFWLFSDPYCFFECAASRLILVQNLVKEVFTCKHNTRKCSGHVLI